MFVVYTRSHVGQWRQSGRRWNSTTHTPTDDNDNKKFYLDKNVAFSKHVFLNLLYK